MPVGGDFLRGVSSAAEVAVAALPRLACDCGALPRSRTGDFLWGRVDIFSVVVRSLSKMMMRANKTAANRFHVLAFFTRECLTHVQFV